VGTALMDHPAVWGSTVKAALRKGKTTTVSAKYRTFPRFGWKVAKERVLSYYNSKIGIKLTDY
jgi:hypothetical protein